jgi:hypothetical protein
LHVQCTFCDLVACCLHPRGGGDPSEHSLSCFSFCQGSYLEGRVSAGRALTGISFAP